MTSARWRLIPVALGIVALAAVGAWTGTSTKAMAQASDPAAPHHPVTKAPAHHPPATAPASQPSPHVEYYCPMHPNIVRDQPGKCPICGMPLQHRAPSPQHPDAAPTTPHNHMN